MPTTFLLLLFLLRLTATATPFLFQGFHDATLTLSNSSHITPTGALCLTTTTATPQLGHAFLPSPLPLRRSPSFSTSFVFSIVPSSPTLRSDHGMALAFTSSPTLPSSLPNQYLGLVNPSLPPSHLVAVELDTVKNFEFLDPDSNHVGIDVNSLTSTNSTSASSLRLTLNSGEPMQLWVDYNATTSLFSVSLAPLRAPKPQTPLLSSTLNLSSILADETYVGFAAATGGASGSHYVLAWSFSMGGEAAQEIDPDALPEVPRTQMGARKSTQNIIFPVVIIVAGLVLICVYGGAYWVKRKKRLEVLVEEEEEISYGPNRIKYRELYRATRGFKEENLVGVGGFGRVYKGTLRGRSGGGNDCCDGQVVAVKRIAHGSRQGVREFVAEISSMARLRHRNLVQLIGYCRREELLLVYDYMANGSLDEFLHGSKKTDILSWGQRFRVVRGVAEGLLYLHEGWEQVVVHRDIKASNVLLDSDFNGRLSDFGLAKIYDRGDDQEHTTRVVGTLGYLAPEMARTGKATTFTDVYAFGAFLLEVACGKRPMAAQNEADVTSSPFLVDWVAELWRNGDILAAVDQRLGDAYAVAEAEVMLKLGVMCSHEVPAARPSMRQVVQALDGDAELPVEPPELGTAAAAAITAAVEAAEGANPMVSFPSPLDRYGNEHSSLTVEVDSCGFSL